MTSQKMAAEYTRKYHDYCNVSSNLRLQNVLRYTKTESRHFISYGWKSVKEKLPVFVTD